jgi:hypothetical protein
MAINQILTDKPPTGFPTLRRHWQGAACGKLLKIHKLLELAQCLAMKIMKYHGKSWNFATTNTHHLIYGHLIGF